MERGTDRPAPDRVERPNQRPRGGDRPMTVDVSKLRTVCEVSKRTPLSEPALLARIDRHEIKVIKIGEHVFLREEDVVAALDPDLYNTTPHSTQSAASNHSARPTTE